MSSDQDGRYQLPAELSNLLEAGEDEDAVRDAWREFVKRYSRLILHTVYSVSEGYDAAMDRYTFVLERLRDHDLHRLRTFAADGRGRFSTWLVVVARRLCEDYRRTLYGRTGTSGSEVRRDTPTTSLRRRLVDLVAEELDPNLCAGNQDGPEMELRRQQLRGALQDALDALTAEDRLMLRLRFDDGLGARETAQVLGLPTPFHVYRRVNAKLRELRRHLAERGFRDATP